MVCVGEEGGNLKEILVRLAEYQKGQQEIISKVRTALAYPLLMLVVGIATVVFILTFVMPKITGLFANMSEKLPAVTQFLIDVSIFIRTGWLWILLFMVIVGALVRQWGISPKGKLWLSQFQLTLPLYGQFILKAELARFARALELLMRSGISVLKGIRVAVPILNNEILKKELLKTLSDVEGGGSLGQSFGKSKLIPMMMTNIVSVGEESGSLETTLHDLADTYEEETNETIKTLTTLLEPAMILFIGAIVGTIVMGMLLPIFQIDILAR